MTQEFTIQQMSFETGLTSYTLRYYEKIGLILDVPRAGSSHRRYDASHLEWIRFLKQLKATGMPLADMKTFAQLRREGPSSAKQRRQMLENHRRVMLLQMNQLQDSLDVVEMKIERHKKTESKLGHPNLSN